MRQHIEALLPSGMPFIHSTEQDAAFMDLALHVRGWSKYVGRKLGAVIECNGRFVSLGFNGLPRGMDDADPTLNVNPAKVEISICAEQNALKNAEMTGASFENGTAHVPWFPCIKCAPILIENGQIKTVVVVAAPSDIIRTGPAAKWGLADSLEMLHRAGIAIRWHDPTHEKYHGLMERKPHTAPVPSGSTDWDQRLMALARFTAARMRSVK